MLALYYPREETDVQPTLFGNVLAAAGDHPRLAYGMVGAVWWPRLLPLLPAEFRTSVGVAQAPMMALVNLSVVFAVLAVGGGTVMVLGGAVWPAAVVVLVGGLVLARLCYLAAVSQMTQLADLIARWIRCSTTRWPNCRSVLIAAWGTGRTPAHPA